MTTPGGVIQRLVMNPLNTQYLKVDAVVFAGGKEIVTLALDVFEPLEVRSPAEWSERRFEAIFFPTHAAADARAALLRAALNDTIFAAVAVKAEHRPRPEIETAGFEPVREMPAHKKVTRAEREREEMQKRDLAELDDVAANG